eukprot:gnl/MRDRNA2_/MRDRNA2_104853_c0_seq1.p1 gnl/MRDRNA2_/MRDRNA2_104853_c0~~gnl/MRDRNA2_/MRDRNA2_104853_c0_seq1.p1  ORF type:complete len:221 (+),score=52.65 gnl/MRDRNA2_/MRDRNA2_104853_c0_seq1:60-722(+)
MGPVPDGGVLHSLHRVDVSQAQLPLKSSSFFSEVDEENDAWEAEALKRWAVRLAERCESDSETVSVAAAQSDGGCDTGSVTSDAIEAIEIPKAGCVCLQGSLLVRVTGDGLHRDALNRSCKSALVDTLSKRMGDEFAVTLVPPPGPGGTFFGRAAGLLKFEFSVLPSDPNDIDMYNEVLMQEAASAGALQLLPGLVGHLSALDELNGNHIQVGLNVQMML